MSVRKLAAAFESKSSGGSSPPPRSPIRSPPIRSPNNVLARLKSQHEKESSTGGSVPSPLAVSPGSFASKTESPSKQQISKRETKDITSPADSTSAEGPDSALSSTVGESPNSFKPLPQASLSAATTSSTSTQVTQNKRPLGASPLAGKTESTTPVGSSSSKPATGSHRRAQSSIAALQGRLGQIPLGSAPKSAEKERTASPLKSLQSPGSTKSTEVNPPDSTVSMPSTSSASAKGRTAKPSTGKGIAARLAALGGNIPLGPGAVMRPGHRRVQSDASSASCSPSAAASSTPVGIPEIGDEDGEMKHIVLARPTKMHRKRNKKSSVTSTPERHNLDVVASEEQSSAAATSKEQNPDALTSQEQTSSSVEEQMSGEENAEQRNLDVPQSAKPTPITETQADDTNLEISEEDSKDTSDNSETNENETEKTNEIDRTTVEDST